ncbi:MAG TPA: SAM-dependent methyltransferase [Myxococcales bacterium]|jgi:predicted methyltransferase|nr:SAM-dependent methyltransferase [Myxococcales bacterium]
MDLRSRFATLTAAALLSCAHAPAETTSSTAPAASAAPDDAALVAAPDRTEGDRKLDPGRNPAGLLAFLGVRPGMRVGELVAGGGYTTELLARAVGPQGTVFAENPAFVVQRFAAKPWAERLERPVNKNVVRADRELEDPFPPEAKDLDLVVMYANYHDAVGLFKTDRAKMNSAVFAALKPGGRYAVVDSSARAGTGAAEVERLHRIDEDFVKQEVQAAGFKLERSDDFMRNPQDPRDWNASPTAAAEKRGTSDRFALMFVKP